MYTLKHFESYNGALWDGTNAIQPIRKYNELGEQSTPIVDFVKEKNHSQRRDT